MGMTNTEIFHKVEDMFCQYPSWQLKLMALQPRSTPREGYLTIPHDMPSGVSAVEALAIERAELSRKIGFVRTALRMMTKDEKRYIELRYFSDLPIKIVKKDMCWSLRQLYRLRTSILSKTAWLLGFFIAA